ncbi:hypothetical protein DY252_06380 [Thalassospira indica]|uniref:Uncharacterized protein n=1 Tax=Thalassospira indica TaxID=1891279 RepID=A0ABM6XW27_9PROT|nr:hypothetical protein DY252_06380 [Thalassospira indica]
MACWPATGQKETALLWRSRAVSEGKDKNAARIMNRDPALRLLMQTNPGGIDPLFRILGILRVGFSSIRNVVCRMGRASIKTERSFLTKGQALKAVIGRLATTGLYDAQGSNRKTDHRSWSPAN